MRKALMILLINAILISQPLGFFWLKGKSAKLVAMVINEEGDPVPGAIIVVPELGITQEARANGIFQIFLPKGSVFHLEIYKDGYAPLITDMYKASRRARIPIKFTISRSLKEEVVVTATSTSVKFQDVPVKTYVITEKKIEEEKPINLAEALSFTTGVRVENNCQNCNYTQVRINGLEGKYSQILVNGLPVISSLASVYGLEQIPSEMIERIEVVKGGASSLYGGNAVAGVINIITREPEENFTVLRFQNEWILKKPLLNIGITSGYVSKDQNTKAFLFASYINRQPVDVNGDGFSNLGLINNTSFGVNLYRFFPSISGKLSLTLVRIFENRRGGDKLNLPPHEATISEGARTYRLDFTLTWQQSLGNDVLNLAFSHAHLRRKSYYGAFQDPNAYGNTKDPLSIFLFQYTHPAGKHVCTLGISYQTEHLQDEAPAYQRIIDDKYTNLGIYLQDDFALTKKIDLLYGVRFDKHSKIKHFITSPRLSFLVKLSKNANLRATFSTGFRAPQVFDEDLHITMIGGEGFIVLNDPELKEERSYSISLGADFFKEKGSNSGYLSFGFFYNRLTDTFVLREMEGGRKSRVFMRINGPGATVYGAEIDGGLKVLPYLEIDAGWTFQKTRLDEPEPEFGAKEIFKSPNEYGFVRLTLRPFTKTKVLITWEHTGSMKLPHYAGYIPEDRLETTPPYSVLSFTFSKAFRWAGEEMEIYAGIYNIFNEFQEDIDRGAYRDAGYIYGPAKPRTIIWGVRYKI